MKKLILIFCMIMISTAIPVMAAWENDRFQEIHFQGMDSDQINEQRKEQLYKDLLRPYMLREGDLPFSVSFNEEELSLLESYIPNYLDLFFNATIVDTAIRTLVPEDEQSFVAEMYLFVMDSDGKISPRDLIFICLSAGWDVSDRHGEYMCKEFANMLLAPFISQDGVLSAANECHRKGGIYHEGECLGRDGHALLYYDACKRTDGDWTRCIRDFKDLSTNVLTGKEFVYQWGRMKKPPFNMTCKNEFESRGSQDFLQCTAGGKAYEFEFDSLNKDQGHLAESSVNNAMCKLFGGEPMRFTGGMYSGFPCRLSKVGCEELNNFAKTIWHSAKFVSYSKDEVCALKSSREFQGDVYTHSLKTAFGIDPKVFYNAGINTRAENAREQAEKYLRMQLAGHPEVPTGTPIYCEPYIRTTLERTPFISDYVLTCRVGDKTIEFLFKDLGEAFDYEVRAGDVAMDCIVEAGGSFRGKTCRINKEQCGILDQYLKDKGLQGARYDDSIRGCVLLNAQTAHRINRGIEIGVGVVVIIGGTIVTVYSGGMTSPVLVYGGAMLMGDAVFYGAMAVNDRLEDTKSARRFLSFLEDANKCQSVDCVAKVLNDNYRRLMEIQGDLIQEDKDDLESALDRLLELAGDEMTECKNDRGETVTATIAECAMWNSTLRWYDVVGNYTEMALTIGYIAYSFGVTPATFARIGRTQRAAAGISSTPTATGTRTVTTTSDVADAAGSTARQTDNIVQPNAADAVGGDHGSYGLERLRNSINDDEVFYALIARQNQNSAITTDIKNITKQTLGISDADDIILVTVDGSIYVKKSILGSLEKEVNLIDALKNNGYKIEEINLNGGMPVIRIIDGPIEKYSGFSLEVNAMRRQYLENLNRIDNTLGTEADKIVEKVLAQVPGSEHGRFFQVYNDFVDISRRHFQPGSPNYIKARQNISNAEMDPILGRYVQELDDLLTMKGVDVNINKSRLSEVIMPRFDRPAARLQVNTVQDTYVGIIRGNTNSVETIRNFHNAVPDDKIRLAQNMVDGISPQYGIQGVKVEIVPQSELGGSFAAQYVKNSNKIQISDIYIKETKDPAGFIGLVAHEFEHAVQHIAPRKTVFGKQLYEASSGIYSKNGVLYYGNLVEQDSYMFSGVADGIVEKILR
ncbi:MAG: hypothetical protein FWG80_04010 [Alphaproteobacteria bacterium]|nr:hypothetical protein [Alphaproteobacteria bacterium]